MAPSKKAEKGTTATKPSKTARKAVGRPKKDPSAPKKYVPAYFLWMNANRHIIKEENQEMNSQQVASRCGQMWKEMSESEKQPWANKAAVAKAAYDEEMEDYKSAKAIAKGRSKPKKDPSAPKKPATAFFLWMNANRHIIKEENQEMTYQQLLARCGQVWREMTADQKKEWHDKYTLAKVAYEEQLEEHKSSTASAQKQQQQQQQPMNESDEEFDVFL